MKAINQNNPASAWVQRATKCMLALTVALAIPAAALGNAIVIGTAADSFSALALDGNVTMDKTSIIKGNAGISAAKKKTFTIKDTAHIDMGNVYLRNNGTVFKNTSTGSSQNQMAIRDDTLLTNAANDVNTASVFAGNLGSDAAFRSSNGFTLGGTFTTTIKTTSTISLSTPGNYVFNLVGINLGEAESLTINAPAGTKIVFDISGAILLDKGATVILAGGVSSEDILWNFTKKKNVTVKKNGILRGSVITIGGKVSVTTGGLIQGNVYAKSIDVKTGGVISPEF